MLTTGYRSLLAAAALLELRPAMRDVTNAFQS